jgi:hypothetical protein
MNLLKSLLLFGCLISSLWLSGQKGKVINPGRPTGNPTSFPAPNTGPSPSFPGSNFRTDSTSVTDTLPTFVYQYFYLNQPRKKFIEGDTTLGNFFNDIEVAKRRPFNMLNTGNNGSALLNPLFESRVFTGFHTGLHQYDHYNYSLDNLPFFDSQRSLADMYFSQILGNQNNFEVGARYGQLYSEGTVLSVNYHRILQEGFYKAQATKTTNFSTMIRFSSLKRKMKSTIGFISNINNEENNGGLISNDSLLKERIFRLRLNVPVVLENADTRHSFADFMLLNEYSLTKYSPDSSAFNVGYNVNYKSGYNKFSDNKTDDQGAINFYRLGSIDPRGIRQYIGVKQLSNEFFARGTYKSFSGKGGITYDRYNITNTINDAVNDITLGFDGVVSMKSGLQINTQAKLGIGENIGTFHIKGNGLFKFGKALNIEANAELFNSQVGYIDNEMYINDQLIYKNDFSNQFGNILQGRLTIPKLNLSVTVGQNLINNYIYRDTNSLAAQATDILLTNYISLSHRLKWKSIHWDNYGFLQSKNSDYITLPSKYIKSDLFFEGLLFKKILRLKLGAEFTYIPSFNLPTYNVITGHYYQGADVVSRDFQNLNVYLSAKVSKLRIFVKYENFLPALRDFGIDVERFNYLSVNQPQFDNNIRFGLRWLFLD